MEETTQASKALISQFKIVAILVAILWIIEIVDFVLQFTIGSAVLDELGIKPRSADGLNGILFAPWLHFGFRHLIANTIPFAILSWFILLQGTRRYVIVTLLTLLIGGLGVWLIGPQYSIHAGASILIFGYFGYLLFNGIFERSFVAMSLTLIVVLLYGSLFWGIFPGIPGVSWQGHLFGFIGGIFSAWMLAKNGRSENDAGDDFVSSSPI